MDFGGWLGGKWNGEGIQLVGSSWAEKNDCSEIEILFKYLFICIVGLRL